MTASALESEHIAQVFDVGEDLDLGLYMVMEYLAGHDLARFLEERGPLGPLAAASIVWQVCLALEHAHAAGVVHRDLKPANVFLTRADDGSIKVKVLDFGIAKRVHEARASAPDAKDVIVGTPRYMSPEQAQGLTSVNHLSDVYSLGSLLFEAIAGSSPYPRLVNSRETLDMILTEDPPRLASRVQEVPPALDELVAELMSRDPSKRPSSAREVRHRLAAICSELGQQPLAPSGPPPEIPLIARDSPLVPARRDRDALIAVAVSVLTAGALVGAILFALLRH
jgi:serine/threonine-protein kinase